MNATNWSGLKLVTQTTFLFWIWEPGYLMRRLPVLWTHSLLNLWGNFKDITVFIQAQQTWTCLLWLLTLAHRTHLFHFIIPTASHSLWCQTARLGSISVPSDLPNNCCHYFAHALHLPNTCFSFANLARSIRGTCYCFDIIIAVMYYLFWSLWLSIV